MSATRANTGILEEPGLADRADRADRACPATRVTFTLRGGGGADEAYVCLGRSEGTARVVERMTRDGRGEWRLELDLGPGAYRYRFYVVEGGRTFFFSPADAGCPCATMDGLDALLDVPATIRGGAA